MQESLEGIRASQVRQNLQQFEKLMGGGVGGGGGGGGHAGLSQSQSASLNLYMGTYFSLFDGLHRGILIDPPSIRECRKLW